MHDRASTASVSTAGGSEASRRPSPPRPTTSSLASPISSPRGKIYTITPRPLAVVQPAAWLWLGRWAGPAPSRALLLGFNVVRIGPMYSNFAHVYTLCHMEAHRRYQLWGRRGPWGYAFNWWVGLFHGVLPGTFTASHLYNHHRFDNDVRDAYSTAGYPRDSIVSLLRYLVVWCFYATNLSTLYDFYKRRMPL